MIQRRDQGINHRPSDRQLVLSPVIPPPSRHVRGVLPGSQSVRVRLCKLLAAQSLSSYLF